MIATLAQGQPCHYNLGAHYVPTRRVHLLVKAGSTACGKAITERWWIDHQETEVTCPKCISEAVHP